MKTEKPVVNVKGEAKLTGVWVNKQSKELLIRYQGQEVVLTTRTPGANMELVVKAGALLNQALRAEVEKEKAL